jgi:glucosyl-3-phosphoglycerate synthase
VTDVTHADHSASDAPDAVRSFDVMHWTLDDALAAKGDTRISLCIPCRDEAATVGNLVTQIRESVYGTLVDELIVIDDRSVDDTAAVACAAGARVVPIEDVHAVYDVGHGKGNVLWASMLVSTGDVVVWCDGDITSFEPSWVVRLVAPLLVDDSVALVKAHYVRPEGNGGGGRTTELVARPLLSLFFPRLAGLHQPLSGEFAGRRSALEQIPFVEGWGVEIAMLIDLAERFGASSIAQVDLGTRMHKHRTLASLSVQAAEVMATLLSRTPAAAAFAEDVLALHRPDGEDHELNLDERPPLVLVQRDTRRSA